MKSRHPTPGMCIILSEPDSHFFRNAKAKPTGNKEVSIHRWKVSKASFRVASLRFAQQLSHTRMRPGPQFLPGGSEASSIPQPEHFPGSLIIVSISAKASQMLLGEPRSDLGSSPRIKLYAPSVLSRHGLSRIHGSRASGPQRALPLRGFSLDALSHHELLAIPAEQSR